MSSKFIIRNGSISLYHKNVTFSKEELLRKIPEQTRDGLGHADEELKDEQKPKLDSLAQGDGNQLLPEKQKTPTRRHQGGGKQAVNAFYNEMLIFFTQFPKFSIDRD
ncbi:hypothetical protein llap_13684 [Limosa lapponica baueri]|uniref:Uncharacterized protein n=1 Tax=Limosa lapponica baueri TaxID=1758121 RepID=A0A2I0TQE3_LIMLA|nr:hypothetical protein llap_13684 [Limosa lapponica baueri]